MTLYDLHTLIIHPENSDDPDVLVEVGPEKAGWETIHFQARRLAPGSVWHFDTGEHELAIVPLSGSLNILSSRGKWEGVGSRPDVFSGLPHGLYLPRNTNLTVTSDDVSEFTVAWTKAEADFPPRLVTPPDIVTEIRGGDHATRQINNIIPPGFPCSRLVVVEVYTPGGNWSSYPPHKHDVHRLRSDGSLLEADLDEIYYYKFDRPEGYALQRVYTGPESPLHQAGYPLDVTLLARENDVILVPEGYHPVSSPPGYTTYYLNVLAGTAQSLAATDDPQYAWVKETYRIKDPRIPIYPIVNSIE